MPYICPKQHAIMHATHTETNIIEHWSHLKVCCFRISLCVFNYQITLFHCWFLFLKKAEEMLNLNSWERNLLIKNTKGNICMIMNSHFKGYIHGEYIYITCTHVHTVSHIITFTVYLETIFLGIVCFLLLLD